MNNKFKNILIFLYGIIILGLFVFFLIYPETKNGDWEVITKSIKPYLTIVTLQLGILTGWMFGNNNNKKR